MRGAATQALRPRSQGAFRPGAYSAEWAAAWAAACSVGCLQAWGSRALPPQVAQPGCGDEALRVVGMAGARAPARPGAPPVLPRRPPVEGRRRAAARGGLDHAPVRARHGG